MKTQKIIITLLVCVLVCASIAGCGAKDEGQGALDVTVGGSPGGPAENQPGANTGEGPVTAPAGGGDDETGPPDGFITGVVCEGEFFHDGQEEWIQYYYADIGEKQFALLEEELGGVYDSGQEVRTEIHLYSMIDSVSLKDFVGEEISFKGECFEAHTIYHRRDIVFEIKEIYG